MSKEKTLGEFSSINTHMTTLHDVIGTRLSSTLDANEKEMNQEKEHQKEKNEKRIFENDADVEKLQKKLSFARESHAFAKEIGDEDRAKLKLSTCLKLEEEIELKME